ncbi:2441_t:CDS:2 [Acaulospora colombiana]|uniref:2441_t:CDS:1 n=1 Tax=Acaulospora colombiana TaxID=27376 RepID=A0ACA9KPF7_9GLOM|nr:2441_t:CDS:2 [Acaulospora colombiana]
MKDTPYPSDSFPTSVAIEVATYTPTHGGPSAHILGNYLHPSLQS